MLLYEVKLTHLTRFRDAVYKPSLITLWCTWTGTETPISLFTAFSHITFPYKRDERLSLERTYDKKSVQLV